MDLKNQTFIARSDVKIMTWGWIMSLLEQVATFIVSQLIAIPFVKWPSFLDDLSHPGKAYGMENAMNIHIVVDHDKKQEVGGWFLQPLNNSQLTVALPRNADEQFEEDRIADDQPYLTEEGDTVILYLHGNAVSVIESFIE